MKGPRRWLFAAVTAAFAACSDPAVVDGQQEIAQELRSLRIALQQQQRPPVAPPAAVPFDRAAAGAVLEPLREVLTGLVRDMDQMQTRQVALTEELQRWSQLLAQSMTGGQKEQADALFARLQQLEQTMQAQDARHREVEGLMSGALERTADRLGDFLQRLEGVAPGGAGGATNPPPTNGEGKASEPKSGEPVKAEPAKNDAKTDAKTGGTEGPDVTPAVAPELAPDRELSAARRAANRNASLWWFGIAGTALLFGVAFAFWLWRENTLARPQSRSEGPPVADEGVNELWAAAALLGEAVGRLREHGISSSPDAGSEAALAALADLDDVFVLDDDLDLPLASDLADRRPVAEPQPEPRPEETELPTELPTVLLPANPPQISFQLSCADPVRTMANVLHVLGSDPRVLRRPEPRVQVAGGRVEVAFCVLPQLHPGERSQLEVHVRDQVR